MYSIHKINHTRTEYLNGSCTHSEYYQQFLCANIINLVRLSIGTNRIVNSTCDYFTDIALVEFENSIRNKHTILLERLKEAEHSGLSKSDIICIAKEAASIIRYKAIAAV